MTDKRNKQKLPQVSPPGPSSQPTSQPVPFDDIELNYALNLEEIRKDVQCPICLGIIRKTRAVMECMHRFCRDCIEKSFRLGNNECPACRTHVASRRSLREDPNFDALVAALFPDIDEYEEKELALSDDTIDNLQKMRKSYSKTYKRQSAALGNKRSVKRTRVGYRRRRNFRNTTQNPESSSNSGRPLSPIAEEREAELIANSDTGEGEAEEQGAHHATRGIVIGEGTSHDMSEAENGTQSNETEGEAQTPHHGIVIRDETMADNVPQPELIRDILSSSDTLVWGRSGRRSSSSNNARSNRLARLIDHLRISEPREEEKYIFVKLVSLEEGRVPKLERPFLTCRPTLSVKKLCEHVANVTSLQTEEIEFYIVKESPDDIVNGDEKIDPNTIKTEFLAREEETIGELFQKFRIFRGHLVIGFNRKRWNLNEAWSSE